MIKGEALTEVFEHNPDDHEDPQPGLTLLVGVIGAVLLAVTVMGLTALYYNTKAEEVTEEVVDVTRIEPAEHYREQEALLTGPPHWVERDEQGKTVKAYVIPIDRAMELVVAESQRSRK